MNLAAELNARPRLLEATLENSRNYNDRRVDLAQHVSAAPI